MKAIKESAKNKLFGKKATCKITGFEGAITGFAQYVTGCDQYLLTPRVGEDKKLGDSHWFDSNRLEVESKPILPKILTKKASGAMDAAPIK